MPDVSVLNTLDWIILSVLLLSIVGGVWRGFSNEFFGLLGLIIAFFFTTFLGRALDGPMASMLPDNAMGHMFGRLIVFFACIMLVNMVASVCANALRAVLSSAVDHSLGLLFGFIRGAITVLLPFLLVNLYIDPKVYPDWLVESHSYPYLNGGAHMLRQILPESEIHDRERTDFGELQKAAKEQQEVLDNAADGAKKKVKNEDSAGNSKWKDIFEALKETLFH